MQAQYKFDSILLNKMFLFCFAITLHITDPTQRLGFEELITTLWASSSTSFQSISLSIYLAHSSSAHEDTMGDSVESLIEV